MNKLEFLNILDAGIRDLSYTERKEIIADYEEHFLRGREIGKTEQQISESLGDPVDIAHEYLENAGQRGQNTTIVQTEQPSKTAQD